MPIDRIPPPPASGVYGSQGPANVPPEAIEAAKEIAARLTQLSDLFAEYARTGDAKVLAKINQQLAAIEAKLNDLHSMEKQLPPDAVDTLDRVVNHIKQIAEKMEQATPGAITRAAVEIGILIGQLERG
jgi:hypothetical protein